MELQPANTATSRRSTSSPQPGRPSLTRRPHSPEPPGVRSVRARRHPPSQSSLASPPLSRDGLHQMNSPPVSTPMSRRSQGQQRRRQRERLERERALPQLPIALRPLSEGPYPRHDLGSMELLCRKCSAFHWDFERAKGPNPPTFRACCDDGKVELPRVRKPPDTLLELLTGDGQGMLDIISLFLGEVHLTNVRCIVGYHYYYSREAIP